MKRILIIRLSAIGDIVFASPIIDALRKKYPDAHLAWLVEAGMQDLLEAHPGLDQVIVWPKTRWKTLWRERRISSLLGEVRAFVRLLRAQQFDTALDLQGLLKSGIWSRISGAKTRIGLGSREGSQYLMTRLVPKGGNGQLIGSEYRFFAGSIGLTSEQFPMRILVSEQAEQQAQNVIHAQGLDQGYVICCPFTTRPQKHWLTEYWQTVIEQLSASLNKPLVVLGGPADQAAAQVLCEGLPAINLAGQTSLPVAAALIRQTDLLIGVDTGLTHLGTTYRRPTVCLFGSTCPYLHTDSPYTKVLYHPRDCSPCRRNPSCDGQFTCMREITPTEVFETATALLAS